MPECKYIPGFAAKVLATMILFAGVGVWAQQDNAPSSVDSAALFLQMAPVLQHPRCMNCHTSTDFPRQGNDGHRHLMQIRRGAEDRGVASLQCTACHQASNSAAGVPGVENWHIAPLRMAWEGLRVGAICRSLTDPARGGMTVEQLVTHMSSDHLVLWAWDAGIGLDGRQRKPPPLPHDEFSALLRQWAASGAHCPAG